MADFVAVLRKTIGTLGDNTPEMREKVYDKARSTIEAKLAAIDPPPPFAVVDRQRKALEDAIAVVRADYETSENVEKDGDLEDVFASLKSMGDYTPSSPAPTPSVAAPAALPRATPVEAAAPTPPRQSPAPAENARPVAAAPVSRRDPVLDVEDEVDHQVEPVAPPAYDPVSAPERPRRPIAAKPVAKKRRTGAIAALAAGLLVVAGGGYALWLNRDDLFGSTPSSPPVAEATEEDGVTTAEELNATPPDEQPVPAEQDVAAAPPQAEQPSPAPAAPVEEPKFTQRLLADGSEVDDGPAGGPRTIGEGTSVASAAQLAEQATPDDTQTEAEAAPTTTQQPAAEPATPAVAVGQRAIFYEERTSAAQGSAEMGAIVWSIVQEPPGGDLPPEPAIRAEATVPGKDVQLRMTIRRNGDQTLPASHIVEMIFLTPDGFEGGTIANVSRISFKETEQAAGNALIGIPAKIADGFFLIALGDSSAEIEANMNLLRRQNWIDIPIVYQTGRRALLTLEKGIPGERVFEEAVRAWTEASSG